MATQKLEFVKLVVQSVVAVREDNKVVNEVVSPAEPIYSVDQLVAFWNKSVEEVATHNSNTNRTSRRK